MRSISDSSYKKLFEMKKYKDLYDFSSLECRVAIVSTILLDIVFIICAYYIGANAMAELCVELLNDIGITLIGFLGFVVSALAILTGSISSKIVKKLKDRNKMLALERIMLSFYLMGLVSAFVVIIDFFLYFIIEIPVNSVFALNVLLLSILSYLIIFIVFYAVKLIGNCLELFYIINEMQLIDDNTVNYKEKYNNYRITALEKSGLGATSIEKVMEYKDNLKNLIVNDDISDEERQILLLMFKEQFNCGEDFKSADNILITKNCKPKKMH